MLSASDPSATDRSAILFLIAKVVAEVRWTDCRALVLDLLKEVMKSPVLEESTKFLRRKFQVSSVENLPCLSVMQDLTNVMNILIDLMDRFPMDSGRLGYDTAVSEVRCSIGEMQRIRDEMPPEQEEDSLEELMELSEKFKVRFAMFNI